MNKQMGFVLACVSALVLYSCSRQDSNGYQINQVDQQFVLGAALANSSEIVLGQLASDSSDTQIIQDYGDTMVLHHAMAHAELKAIAGSLLLYAPDSLDGQHSALYNMLLTKTGRELDSLYIHGQVQDHQATIALFENEVRAGTNFRLRKHAHDLLPLLRAHLDSAQDIADQY